MTGENLEIYFRKYMLPFQVYGNYSSLLATFYQKFNPEAEIPEISRIRSLQPRAETGETAIHSL